MSYQYSISKESDASAAPLTTSGQRRPRKVHATTFTPEVAVRRPTTSDAAAAGVASTPARADTTDAVMASMTQRLASTSPPCKAVDDVSVTKMEITTDCSETGTNGVDTGNEKDLKPEDMDCGDAVTATATVTSTCEDTARTCPVQQSKSIESESSDINVSEVDDDSHSIVVDQPEDSVLDLSFSVKNKRHDVSAIDAAVTSHVKLAVTERDRHKDKAHSSSLTTAAAAAAAGNSVHENGGSKADSSSGAVISPTRNAPIDRTLSSAGSGSSGRSSAASSHAKPPSHRPDTGRASVERAPGAAVESKSMTSRDALETASGYPFSLDPYSLASSSYMSFDPRILQFYSDDERRKWALSGFMPALYAQPPPPSPRDSLLAAAAAGEHGALQSISRLANPAAAAALFADHVTSHGAQLSDRQFSAAAFLPKHESSSSSASHQSKAAPKPGSEKTARKLSLTDRPVGDKPEIKCFPRNLNTATSQAAKLKTEPGKKAKAVTDREASRNRATPPAVTAASAQQSSGACV